MYKKKKKGKGRNINTNIHYTQCHEFFMVAFFKYYCRKFFLFAFTFFLFFFGRIGNVRSPFISWYICVYIHIFVHMYVCMYVLAINRVCPDAGNTQLTQSVAFKLLSHISIGTRSNIADGCIWLPHARSEYKKKSWIIYIQIFRESVQKFISLQF